MPRLSWGTGIVLVYSAFAMGTLGMVTFAIGHPVDLVGADYYQQSTAYDARLAAIARADAVGEALAINVNPTTREVQVHLPPAHLARASGMVTLYRPSNAADDRRWPFLAGAAHTLSVPFDGRPAGVWRVRVEWTVDGQSFYREQIVYLP